MDRARSAARLPHTAASLLREVWCLPACHHLLASGSRASEPSGRQRAGRGKQADLGQRAKLSSGGRQAQARATRLRAARACARRCWRIQHYHLLEGGTTASYFRTCLASSLTRCFVPPPALWEGTSIANIDTGYLSTGSPPWRNGMYLRSHSACAMPSPACPHACLAMLLGAWPAAVPASSETYLTRTASEHRA